MALATQEDVEARLGRQLTLAEAERLPSALSDASALVIGWAGQDFEPAPYPDAVVGVTAQMVARLFSAGSDTRAPFAQQQTNGPFTVTFAEAAVSGDVWLSKTDKMMLRPHRRSGGLTSVQLVGERYDITPEV